MDCAFNSANITLYSETGLLDAWKKGLLSEGKEFPLVRSPGCLALGAETLQVTRTHPNKGVVEAQAGQLHLNISIGHPIQESGSKGGLLQLMSAAFQKAQDLASSIRVDPKEFGSSFITSAVASGRVPASRRELAKIGAEAGLRSVRLETPTEIPTRTACAAEDWQLEYEPSQSINMDSEQFTEAGKVQRSRLALRRLAYVEPRKDTKDITLRVPHIRNLHLIYVLPSLCHELI